MINYFRSFDRGEELEFDIERMVITELNSKNQLRHRLNNGEIVLKWRARNVTGPGGRYVEGVHGYKIRPELIDEYYSR